MPGHPVEQLRESYLSTRRGATDLDVPEPVDQAYMAIMLASMQRTSWKSKREEHAVGLAIRAIAALSAISAGKRRAGAAQLAESAQRITQQIVCDSEVY